MTDETQSTNAAASPPERAAGRRRDRLAGAASSPAAPRSRPEVLLGAAFAGGFVLAMILSALPVQRHPESTPAAVTEVSERVTVLIREEIELAKAEIPQKVNESRAGHRRGRRGRGVQRVALSSC